MNSATMKNMHHPAKPWLWPLQARQAATLAAADAPRWLRVDEGCLWVTAQRSDPQGGDIWLDAGGNLFLPAGSAWVVQAWPSARLSLLQAAPAPSRAASSWPAAWRLFWQRVHRLARPRAAPRAWA